MRCRQNGQTIAPFVDLKTGRDIGRDKGVIRHGAIVPKGRHGAHSFTMFLLCSQEQSWKSRESLGQPESRRGARGGGLFSTHVASVPCSRPCFETHNKSATTDLLCSSA